MSEVASNIARFRVHLPVRRRAAGLTSWRFLSSCLARSEMTASDRLVLRVATRTAMLYARVRG